MTEEEFLRKLASTIEMSEGLSLTVDTQLSDIWDSMGQIGVLSMLQEEFNVALEMDELVTIKSVQDIIDILRSRNINFE